MQTRTHRDRQRARRPTRRRTCSGSRRRRQSGQRPRSASQDSLRRTAAVSHARARHSRTRHARSGAGSICDSAKRRQRNNRTDNGLVATGNTHMLAQLLSAATRLVVVVVAAIRPTELRDSWVTRDQRYPASRSPRRRGGALRCPSASRRTGQPEEHSANAASTALQSTAVHRNCIAATRSHPGALSARAAARASPDRGRAQQTKAQLFAEKPCSHQPPLARCARPIA